MFSAYKEAILLLLLGLFLIVVCVVFGLSPTNVSLEQAIKIEKVGFWHGLLHGLIFTTSFIISIFDKNVTMYAIYNTGIFYNLGFFLGVTIPYGIKNMSMRLRMRGL